jgi:hypothetical protein
VAGAVIITTIITGDTGAKVVWSGAENAPLFLCHAGRELTSLKLPQRANHFPGQRLDRYVTQALANALPKLKDEVQVA